jgi:hypothetical protein
MSSVSNAKSGAWATLTSAGCVTSKRGAKSVNSADLVGGPAQRVLEQGEQELVLPVELQVEAPQRLAGAVHDLLDGEVRAALFDDDRLRRVEEPLNALRRAQFRGLDRPLHGPLLPGGFFARAGHWRLG